MDAAAVAAISAATLALTQIVKRALPGDTKGPYIAAILSLVGVLVWVFSAPAFPPARTDLWGIFSAWITVYSGAMGLYGVSKIVTDGGGGRG